MIARSPKPLNADAKPVKEVLDNSILRVDGLPGDFEDGSPAATLFNPEVFYMMSSGLMCAWPLSGRQQRQVNSDEDVS
jgi:hypothetical protein